MKLDNKYVKKPTAIYQVSKKEKTQNGNNNLPSKCFNDKNQQIQARKYKKINPVYLNFMKADIK